MHTRQKWAIGEEIALQWYLSRGWKLVSQNFTMRWGEIDLIVENTSERRYIEVKMIDSIDDLHWFVTTRKLQRVTKTLTYHGIKFPTDKLIQLDVVFVKW
jgi:putative endonuclease